MIKSICCDAPVTLKEGQKGSPATVKCTKCKKKCNTQIPPSPPAPRPSADRLVKEDKTPLPPVNGKKKVSIETIERAKAIIERSVIDSVYITEGKIYGIDEIVNALIKEGIIK